MNKPQIDVRNREKRGEVSESNHHEVKDMKEGLVSKHKDNLRSNKSDLEIEFENNQIEKSEPKIVTPQKKRVRFAEKQEGEQVKIEEIGKPMLLRFKTDFKKYSDTKANLL